MKININIEGIFIMKWLFVALLGLNLIVFAGMIASKIYIKEQDETAKSTQPPTIIINQTPQQGQTTATVAKASDVAVVSASGTATQQTKVVAVKPKDNKEKEKPKEGKVTITASNNDSGGSARNEPTREPRVRYTDCSARVNMPEDDYHRIKGLLHKYPHAASRQVTENHGEGGGQTSSRMNVLFMSVSDQDASAIQAVVGRYGQLSRTPCNK